MKERREIRLSMKPRYWHIPVYALLGAACFVLPDYSSVTELQTFASLKDVWYSAIFGPLLCGSLVTLGAGGASLSKRIIGGSLCGCLIGILSTVIPSVVGYGSGVGIADMVSHGIWRAFVGSVISSISVILTEIKLPGKVSPCSAEEVKE